MGHYDNCRPGNCGVCGQRWGICEHTKGKKDPDAPKKIFKKLSTNEMLKLIKQAHEILDRLDKSLTKQWFEEED